jgi:hypothetical protein
MALMTTLTTTAQATPVLALTASHGAEKKTRKDEKCQKGGTSSGFLRSKKKPDRSQAIKITKEGDVTIITWVQKLKLG